MKKILYFLNNIELNDDFYLVIMINKEMSDLNERTKKLSYNT